MYKKVLVPLDGSVFAEGVLGEIIKLARAEGSEVVLLRVGALPRRTIQEGGRTIYLDEQLAWSRRELEEYLGLVRRRLRALGLRTRIATAFGDPAEEILRYAREEGVDLIAMSTHGRSGLAALLHHNVARKVQRGAQVPVLLKRVGEELPQQAA
jgi:nucleotide-binding universal stress UspA family protein